jgi:hypothetical protein
LTPAIAYALQAGLKSALSRTVGHFAVIRGKSFLIGVENSLIGP